MAFYLLQVLFGAALILVGIVLEIVALVIWIREGEAGMFGAWGLGFLGLGVIVIALA